MDNRSKCEGGAGVFFVVVLLNKDGNNEKLHKLLDE